MTERQRQLFAWTILSLVALLIGHIVASILSPVLGWLTTVFMQIFDAAGLPGMATTILFAAMRVLIIAAKCAAVGFAYRVFFNDRWSKAGLHAWGVIIFWNAAPGAFHLASLLSSFWFWTDTAASGVGAFAGAWFALQHRHNQHVLSVRDALLGLLRID